MVLRSLDELILQMNERTLDALYERLAAAVVDQPQPGAAIRALARAYIVFALTETPRWLAIYQHRLPEGQTVPTCSTARWRECLIA